jgi:hypothetical protein
LLCRRVLEQGVSLTAAAEAAGVSERTARRDAGELLHIDIKKLPRIDRDGRHDPQRPAKPSLRRK